MLTLAERRTEEFIQKFFKKNGYSPTASEIADGIGIKSRGVVHRYLKALVNAGRIILIPKRHRNIHLLDSMTSPSIPLLGTIAAGRPIEAIVQQENVDLSSLFVKPNFYALKVKGDSMIEEGICDGDIVICQKSNTADNGQIVVALIDQEEATLKRLQKNKNNTVTLHAANSSLKPMIYNSSRVMIQGIYVGLVRVNFVQ